MKFSFFESGDIIEIFMDARRREYIQKKGKIHRGLSARGRRKCDWDRQIRFTNK